MTVRAKLRLTEIGQNVFNPEARKLRFFAQYDESIPEDRRFQRATPSACADFMVDTPTALAQFELGKSYYVDFTPCDPQ